MSALLMHLILSHCNIHGHTAHQQGFVRAAVVRARQQCCVAGSVGVLARLLDTPGHCSNSQSLLVHQSSAAQTALVGCPYRA